VNTIKKIRIKNFKSLEDVEIEIKPLTFLLGPNGSGKSSFLKALKFLHKNIFPLKNLIEKKITNYEIGNNINLGSFNEINSKYDETINLQYEFVISGLKLNEYSEILEIKNKSTDVKSKNDRNLVSDKSEIEFMKSFRDLNYIGIKSKFLSSDYPFLLGYSHFSRDEEYKIKVLFKFEKFMDFNNIKVTVSDIKNKNFLVINEPEENINNLNIFTSHRNSKINFLNNDEYCNYFLKDLFQNIKYDTETEFIIPKMPDLQDFIIGNLTLLKSYDNNNKESQEDYNNKLEKEELIIQNWLKLSEQKRISKLKLVLEFIVTAFYEIWKSLNLLGKTHLPTVREIPKPKYLLVNTLFNEYEYYNFLNKFWDHQVSDDTDDVPFPGIQEVANDFLKILGFDKKIEIIKNKDIGSIFIKDKNENKINLANESSGLIQLVPILLSLADNSLLSVEQPELHLHPKLQAAFADVLMVAERFNNNKYLNKKSIYDKDDFVLIETHSEHIIRKIQVLIAKGKLDREKIAVYYFDKTEGTTKVKKMEIEENGFFNEPWPNGFFDDSANLSWELLTANKN